MFVPASFSHVHLSNMILVQEPVVGPYSGIRDLVLGFDKKVLQAAFQVSTQALEISITALETNRVNYKWYAYAAALDSVYAFSYLL